MDLGGKLMSNNMSGISVSNTNKHYTLTITADDVNSTDDRFTMNNLSLGDNYKPINSLFKSANGTVITRKKIKYEKKYQTRLYQDWLVRFMKTSWIHSLKKKEEPFRFVNILQVVRLYAEYILMLKNLRTIEIRSNI